MPTATAALALPFPVGGDDPDIPGDMGALAARVDAILTAAADPGIDLKVVRNFVAAQGNAGQVRIGGYGSNAGFSLGLAGDTDFYREAAGVLRTSGDLRVTGNLSAQRGLGPQVLIGAYGPGGESGFQFNSLQDTNFYRSAAGTLKTSGKMYATQTVAGGVGTGNEVGIGWTGLPAGAAGIYFGSAADTNLYRYGAGILKTDGTISTGLTNGSDRSVSGAWMSSLGGVYSTRALVGDLAFRAAVIGDIGNRWQVTGDGTISWGPGNNAAVDTQLVRLKAGALGTQQAPIGATTVTSLPTAPVDQQECYFLADATNGIIWRMRYRAGSASAYKWEIVGAATPLRADTDTSEQSSTGGAANTWNNLGTPCSVVAPLAGEYEVGWQAAINFPGAGANAYGWVVPNIFQDNTGLVITGSAQNADGLYVHVNRTRKATLTAGQTVNLQSRWSNGGHNNIYKTLTLRPSRVG